MSLKCHIWQLVHVQIWDDCVILYALYELSASNNVTRSICIHTFHIIGMCPNKYACHTVHTHTHTIALLLWSTHRLHITTHTCLRTNCNIQHVTAIYMPATNMSLKCHIHKLFDMYEWGKYTLEMSYMNSTASTMWPGVKYTNYNYDKSNTQDNTALFQKPSWPNQSISK